ncbi:hypothetical protein BGY98DRAFT_982636 [Russula aff. rugulosa BPL654]|nr:hypothetical protein BGY98DRAFT_982636 [Russula aff. rugulosa BPL654]
MDNSFPSRSFILWKPLRDIPVKPSDSLAERIGNLGLDFSQFAKKLDTADQVAVRSRVTDDDLDLPWLKELHEKIWNQKGRRPEIFRKVKVTQADYVAPQKQLDSDRDSPDYNGTESDVSSIKLNFLLSLAPAEASSQQHPDDSDDRVDNDDDASNDSEDDVVLKSLFPYILDFLDLSTLGLKEAVPTRFPLPLLLRKEYKEISQLIKDKPRNSGGSVLVSGQPGIGKTAYLYLRMVEHMIEGRPFLFQSTEDTVYHVAEEGVEVVQSWSSKETIVAFVDGDDEKNHAPKRMLTRLSSVQLIVASSPNVSSEKWIKQAGHGSFVTRLAINLWSQKELLITGIFLHRLDLPFKLLRESTLYFGYNPHQCFKASSSAARLDDIKDSVVSAIEEAAMTSNFVQLFCGTRSGALDVSHKIFQNFPSNGKRLLSGCQFEPVSRWALDFLLRHYEDRKSDAAADFYYSISGMLGAASLQGHLFERQVLNHLGDIASIPAKSTFDIRGLTDSNLTKWTCHGAIRRITFDESTIFNELTEAVRNRTPVHLVPSARNFAAVDSILYDPDDPNAVLTCIQITMNMKQNMKHPIAVSGLKLIQRWLKRESSLDGLRPQKNRPWRFLFVVPSDDASKFKSQRFIGDTRTGEWAGKVHQYVLGLREQTIFGRSSDSIVQHASTSKQRDRC